MPAAKEDVRIVLGLPGKAEVKVVGPDGEPVASARVSLGQFGRELTIVPRAVVNLTDATTDQNGLAVIDAAANDEISHIAVRLDGVRQPVAIVLPR